MHKNLREFMNLVKKTEDNESQRGIVGSQAFGLFLSNRKLLEKFPET